MKILFFSPYFYPYTSGITTYPQILLSQLVKDNLVTVLTFPHAPKLPKYEVHQAIHIHRMPVMLKISKGFISIASIPAFWREARTNDVVMINIPNAEGLLLAIFAKLFRKKLIALYHCQVFLGQSLLARLISTVLNLSVTMQLNLADQITVYTKEYAHTVGLWQKHKKKIRVVLPPVPHPTIDTNYATQLQKQKKDQVWIGFAGRISREKGLENLVKAVAQLRRGKMKNLALVFAGPYGADVAGEQAYYEKLVKLLRKYAVPHQFFGTLKGGKLGAFYQAIELLCLPSTNKTEAFGMVQVEAMMMGTPVVCSNLPGVRIPIKTTGMGKTVKPGNPTPLANGIKTVLDDLEQYRDPKLVESVQQAFRLEQTVEAYQKIIRSVTEGSSKKFRS